MECIVNGVSKQLPDGISVEELIKNLGLSDAVCAAEVDKQIVPKRQRAGFTLSEGQRIEIVTLVGGG